MHKKTKMYIAAFIFMALVFSIYGSILNTIDRRMGTEENNVETSIKDKNSQLDLPFLESLTRHFLALRH